MIQKIKDFILYRKNKKIAKRELAGIAATVLPCIRDFTGKKSELVQFIMRVADSSKDVDGKDLFAFIIREAADKLAADETRIMELLQYIVRLSPEDIDRLIIHSLSETIDR